MCYDISFEVSMRQLSDYFPDLIYDSQMEMEFQPFDHVQGVSVFKEHPIIYRNRQDMQLHCRLMSWGVVPHYETKIPDWKRRNGMLNIRAERIQADKQSYWYKIRNRRCLIPVSGIFEHRAIKGWKKKVPYWVKPEEQNVFFLPGLYSISKIFNHETEEWYEYASFGLITRAANSLMAQIHNDGENKNRMPLFLPLALSKRWLEEDLSDEVGEYEAILDYEMPAEELAQHPVYTIRTPKERPDAKSKSECFEWEKLPPLGEMNP